LSDLIDEMILVLTLPIQVKLSSEDGFEEKI